MKFSSPIQFSRGGIYFKFLKYSFFLSWHGAFTWQILKPDKEILPYKNSSKLLGLDYTTLVSDWVSWRYTHSHIIILTNINVEAKNIQFWAKVPKTDMVEFVKDVVILHCKDKTEVYRLTENIPLNFADAYGYSAGVLIIHNKDNLV